MLKFSWAYTMLGAQGGKVEAEADLGLRVVMFGRGLHKALLLLKSLQHQQSTFNDASSKDPVLLGHAVMVLDCGDASK